MDHVPEEVRFLRLRALGHGDVWQHLLLQDLLRIPQTTLAVETGRGTTIANEVERNLQQCK